MENEPTSSTGSSPSTWRSFGPIIVAMIACGACGAVGHLLSPSTMGAAVGAAIGGGVAAVGVLFGANLLFGRFEALVPYAEGLARGRPVDPPADLGGMAAQVGRSLELLSNRSKTLEATITTTSATLRSLASAIEPSSEAVRAGVEGDRKQAEAARERLEQTREQLVVLHRVLDDVSRAAEDSQSAALELATTNDVVSENVHQLAESVDETAASIEEMTYSIKEVARNIEDLSLAAEQTATSMNQMDTSISEVESNVKITAGLADEVARDAGTGAEAVQRTLEGIDKIRDTVSTAASVITGLGERIREIGNILSVIEDVAEQTNLLALNAAIIAAQAGEHGRGFAVVADEIKELADKTGASTKEISALILNIQEESRNAVDAMSIGEKNVHEGVTLSREAEGALAKILDSAEKSTQRFKTIAAATVEQARGSKIVADAVERIARSVQQVAAATSEQARGSEQLMRSAERIKGITHQVERTSREQGIGSKQILQFIEGVGSQVQNLTTAEAAYKQAWEETERRLEQLIERGREQDASLEVLQDLPSRLRNEADRSTAIAGEAGTNLPSPV